MAGLTRVADWPSRLAAEIEAARHAPFAWGQHDCAMWAARVVDAITGSRIVAEWSQAAHSDAASAARRIAEAGGLEAIADRYLERVAPRFAQRGDVVLFDCDGRPTLGIVAGVTIAAPAPEGLAFVPVTAARIAWRVG